MLTQTEFLGYNQLLIKDYKKSENYLLEALKIREKLKDDFATMLNYTALGEYYKETKQYKTSNDYFLKSNAVAKKINFVDIQKYNRQIKFLVDWWEAVGFGYNCMVWTTRETVADVNPIAITAVDAKLTTSPAVTLQATPEGCVFSGVGVTLVEGTYKFTPSVAGAGTHTIKATLAMANDNKWEKTIAIVVTAPEG